MGGEEKILATDVEIISSIMVDQTSNQYEDKDKAERFHAKSVEMGQPN